MFNSWYVLSFVFMVVRCIHPICFKCFPPLSTFCTSGQSVCFLSCYFIFYAYVLRLYFQVFDHCGFPIEPCSFFFACLHLFPMLLFNIIYSAPFLLILSLYLEYHLSSLLSFMYFVMAFTVVKSASLKVFHCEFQFEYFLLPMHMFAKRINVESAAKRHWFISIIFLNQIFQSQVTQNCIVRIWKVLSSVSSIRFAWRALSTLQISEVIIWNRDRMYTRKLTKN